MLYHLDQGMDVVQKNHPTKCLLFQALEGDFCWVYFCMIFKILSFCQVIIYKGYSSPKNVTFVIVYLTSHCPKCMKFFPLQNRKEDILKCFRSDCQWSRILFWTLLHLTIFNYSNTGQPLWIFQCASMMVTNTTWMLLLESSIMPAMRPAHIS